MKSSGINGQFPDMSIAQEVTWNTTYISVLAPLKIQLTELQMNILPAWPYLCSLLHECTKVETMLVHEHQSTSLLHVPALAALPPVA